MGQRWLVVLLAAWVVALASGILVYHAYATTPRTFNAPPSRWPAASHLPAPREMHVLMFVHPGCPCTRASLRELEDAVRAQPSPPAVTIVLAEPGDEIATLVRRIPRAQMIADDGTEALRFEATTSGFTLVYDADGALAFAGGITGSRGHVGANVGAASLRAVLAGHRPETTRHAVFGCSLGGHS
jgi:hypothetical protein